MALAVETSVNLDWEEWQGDIPFWRHAIAGSIAGVSEHIAMFPLDTVKTRLQAYGGVSGRSLGFSEAFRSIINERGFSGLLRGWTAIAGGCIPAHIALFSVYEQSKRILSSSSGELTSERAALCGAVSTLAHDMILTPMDVVKQRLQLGCYAGASDCVRSLIRSEGFIGLYRSLPTTLFINAPYGAVFVALNEKLKDHSFFARPSNQYSGIFAAAGLSAAGAALATHPLDVVKTRLQTQDILCLCPNQSPSCSLQQPPSAVVKYPSFLQAVRTIFLEEGLAGFYRGLLPRTLLSIPSAATCWGVYESAKRILAAPPT
jgi:solute carrier family 25 iron transporter 28/37